FIIIVIQVSVALILSFGHYDMDCEGSMFGIVAISILSALCGMVYGMIWPIEGMPKVLKWFSLMLPMTVPGNTLREIMHKGTDFHDPDVYSGFLVISAWILGLLVISLFQLKRSG
ncbi:unnamed protein product, partial [Heterotrigona itama]